MGAAITITTKRLRRALSDRRVVLVCVLLGLLLASPALSSGLLADDIGHRAFILAKLAGETDRPWWDMFVLVGATPEELEKLRYLGQVPWWTNPEVHIAFWRPLSAGTHYLDYTLWPEAPWLMHLHQLAWHGLACALVWVLFRRLASSASAAGAGALAFALTHLHMSAAAWLAHRNAVLVLVFGLLCLIAHDRWRRVQWRLGVLLGPMAFLAALLSGEMGVGVLGFVMAYALTHERASRGSAAASLVPYLLVLVVWRLAYDALGYGVTGSGVYLDPVAEPGLWLRAMPGRILELLVYTLGPPGKIGGGDLVRLVGAVLVLGATLMAARSGPGGVRRSLGFAGLGGVLSLVPLTTTLPHDRILVLVTIGSCLAFGEVVDAALARERPWLGLGAGVVVVVHFLISPAAAVLLASKVEGFKIAGAGDPVAASLDDSKLRRQSLVVLHTPDLLYATLLPLAREARGLNRPNFTWVLHAEPTAGLESRRIDARTLELHDPQGWLRGPDSRLVRGPDAPFEVGDEVRTLDYELEVLAVSEGRPTRIAVRFRTSLDNPSFVVATWGGDDFEPCPGAGAPCPAGQ